MAFLKGQGLLLLLIQHAVNCDELIVQRYDIWKANGRPEDILWPVHRSTLRYPSNCGKHAYKRERVR